MNAVKQSISDKLRDVILGTVPAGVKDKVESEIISMEAVEIFYWLAKQDPSLCYYIALELDIPLQHLDNTCQTLKHIHDL